MNVNTISTEVPLEKEKGRADTVAMIRVRRKICHKHEYIHFEGEKKWGRKDAAQC